MNYYERYCGDYGRDTMHLTLEEHGAYNLMLDTYYATERPLPADSESLFRICRAMSRQERASVMRVADQFFPLAEDGLRHNKRADREIADAQPRLAAARENGKRGGRPIKTQRVSESKPSGFENQNPAETQRGVGVSVVAFDLDVAFAEFWAAYPRRVGKAKAMEAWRKLKPDPALCGQMLKAIAAQSATADWQRDDGKFIPHPTTWLHGRRWEDEIPAKLRVVNGEYPKWD